MQRLEIGGKNVPVIGQGTWRMGEDASQQRDEVAALRLGIEQGLTLIDTAEMYGEGGAERIVGQAIAGYRDQVYLVSKVYPHNANQTGVAQACERSLQRMGTEHIDLYLLHWAGQYPIEETVEAFERLREQGKIGRWGVSNFDTADMEAMANPACATDQVLYNPEARGVEYDLLPWAERQGMPVMAYCPIAQGGRFLEHPVLEQLAGQHQVTPAEICLAWVVRSGNVIAIPKAVDPAHVRLNARAAGLRLSPEDLAQIDTAFPAPLRKQHLRMV